WRPWRPRWRRPRRPGWSAATGSRTRWSGRYWIPSSGPSIGCAGTPGPARCSPGDTGRAPSPRLPPPGTRWPPQSWEGRQGRTRGDGVRRAGYEDGVRLLSVALAFAGPGSNRGGLLCALGEAALAAGDPDRARAAYAEAAELARRTGRVELLAAAALGVAGGQ